MVDANNIIKIKEALDDKTGLRVKLISNKGKKKALTREGVLEATYPSVFTVRMEGQYSVSRRVSFSYTDVLTRNIDIVFLR